MRFLASVLAVLALAASSSDAGKLVDSTSGYGYTVTDTAVVNSNTLNWPADWSRRAFPLPVHSHNDYWQDVPVLTALSLGCRSIESDVWLYNSELYVGHDPYSLTVNRTFQSLTISPIMEALDQANRANSRYKYADTTQSNFFAGLQTQILATQASPHNWTGYWQLGVGNSAPIQVLVDVKTDGNATWPYVVQKLQPLRDLGWLTRYENGRIIPGPVTIIGTGNTPINQVAPLTSRDYFFDCPLGQLNKTAYTDPTTGTVYSYNSTLCGIASVDWEHFNGGWEGVTNITAAQAANLTAPVVQAHALNIPTRYWDNPNWPTYARDTVNAFLLSIGSDWINADDLEAIAAY